MAPRRPASGATSSRSKPGTTTSTTPSDGSSSVSFRRSEAKTKPPPPPVTASSRSKIMKRTQRHDAFMSRIAKRASPLKATKKRRRPAHSSQELASTLAGLADALPDPDTGSATGGSSKTKKSADAIDLAGPKGPVRLRNTSLRSRAGAQKKRAALESLERDWFQRNLASMTTMAHRNADEPTSAAQAPTTEGSGSAQSTHSPWEALKAHIAGTLQKTKQADA